MLTPLTALQQVRVEKPLAWGCCWPLFFKYFQQFTVTKKQWPSLESALIQKAHVPVHWRPASVLTRALFRNSTPGQLLLITTQNGQGVTVNFSILLESNPCLTATIAQCLPPLSHEFLLIYQNKLYMKCCISHP